MNQFNPKVLISLIEKWMEEGDDDSQEYKDFLEILENPPPLNEKFKQAFKDYHERKEKGF